MKDDREKYTANDKDKRRRKMQIDKKRRKEKYRKERRWR